MILLPTRDLRRIGTCEEFHRSQKKGPTFHQGTFKVNQTTLCNWKCGRQKKEIIERLILITPKMRYQRICCVLKNQREKWVKKRRGAHVCCTHFKTKHLPSMQDHVTWVRQVLFTDLIDVKSFVVCL
jgi:c-di-GMP-related signal transduction protein